MGGRGAGLVSGFWAFLLLVAVFSVVLDVPLVRGSGTIYIRADGSIDPPWPITPIWTDDNITYTFTGDIYDSIAVERSSIVLDGGGFTLWGPGGVGIDLTYGSNVTVMNIDIREFDFGIYVLVSDNNTISGNIIVANHGIQILGCFYNTIVGNTMTGYHEWYGIEILESSNSTIVGNTVSNYLYGIYLDGSNNVLKSNSMAGNRYNFGVGGYINDVDSSNTVDGKPIYYWINERDKVVPSDGGYVALVDSHNITVKGLELKNNVQGVVLANTTNSQICNNNITANEMGILEVAQSSKNSIAENNIADNGVGIYLLNDSSNNNIVGNNITSSTSFGHGITSELGQMYGSSNNSIIGNNIKGNFGSGIRLGGPNNTISRNTVVANNQDGIYLGGYNNSIVENTITENTERGIAATGVLHTAVGNTVANNGYGIQLLGGSFKLRNNNMYNNTLNFDAESAPLQDFPNDIDTSNKVDGKPIYYWIDERDKAVPSDAGYVALVNSYNITVKGLELKNNGQGVFFWNTTNSKIQDNSITANKLGVMFFESSNNAISKNIITTSWSGGIFFRFSSDNSISGNTIKANGAGIDIAGDIDRAASNNSIYENNITNNEYGIHFNYANYNRINANNITNNWRGVRFYMYSNYNRFYHNNFVSNTIQVESYYGSGLNIWDDGYPSGGNYWSNYIGVDMYWGPYQNETGSDGIGDAPHIPPHPDNYPLMSPYEYWSNPILGDINKDMKVDNKDLSQLAAAYGTTPEKPNWNPNCDINSDNKVEVFDLFNLSKNYGKTKP